ncbi:Prefoldin [Schizophyllum commune]
MAAKQRERRIVQLTIDELSQLDNDTKMYKGVGKMFLMTPRKEMESELKAQEKELGDDLTNLAKKSKFLEKQFNDASGQLRDIFNSAPKQ